MQSDRITLKNLMFYAYHGVFAAEKELGQRFEVDVARDRMGKRRDGVANLHDELGRLERGVFARHANGPNRVDPAVRHRETHDRFCLYLDVHDLSLGLVSAEDILQKVSFYILE